MSYEMKEASGSLFKNDRKQSDSHPDYTGTLLLNGVKYRISGWVNETKSGQKYLGLKVKEMEESTEPVRATDATNDLPF